MALKRTSTAVWHGKGPTGSGTITTLSGAFKDQPYSVNTRFTSEDGKAGTNPEELIAAAHAGCFSMALSAELGKAGLKPERIDTMAAVTLDTVDGKPTVTKSHLTVRARVPGADREKFMEVANGAKAGCPISRLLKAEITMEAMLES